eukprot:UN26834
MFQMDLFSRLLGIHVVTDDQIEKKNIINILTECWKVGDTNWKKKVNSEYSIIIGNLLNLEDKVKTQCLNEKTIGT